MKKLKENKKKWQSSKKLKSWYFTTKKCKFIDNP